MTIGVFDSGKGGEIVAKRLRRFFPKTEFVVVNDHQHLPYGDKTPAEITRLTDRAIQPLIQRRDIKIIIIACNTATAVAIAYLRAKYPERSFIGFEPAIKPAASGTRAKKIIVLATPATLQSAKYLALKKRFAKNVTVIEPDCSTWAAKIENGEFREEDLLPVLDLARREQVDKIVLGCTHYLDIENDLRRKLPPTIAVIEPIAAIARRLDDIMRGMC
ncbi:aspartate/glutamate racemase family protein [Candidatus Saccharibacteria bacterium]|nr:aspartate/glutamate racemase family protein [Candidatus Saccharibacteria bacterium]